MASVTFFPGRLTGPALVPPAKSEAHRALLLAAFGDHTCRLHGFPPPLCDDTYAMMNGITALGASVRQEGTQLVQTCTKLLDEAQLQIKKVMTAADGSPVMEDFADEE